MYQQVIGDLRNAYTQKVEERSRRPLQSWKVTVRARFLAQLQAEGKHALLEIGAGTGHDSCFFQQAGLTVTCTDLTPAMVEYCRSRGLAAEVVDFAQLAVHFAAASFDAIYAMNCLLHVPKTDFPGILQGIRTILRLDGLFFLGQYGGVDEEGVWAGDHYEPKRFFARYRDEQLLAIVEQLFAVEEFQSIPPDDGSAGTFQALVLRKTAQGSN